MYIKSEGTKLNKLGIAAVLATLYLIACNSDADSAKTMRPTVIAYGDSQSQGYSGHARYDLRNDVDYRHDDWDQDGFAPVDRPYFYALQAKHAVNDGTSAQLLARMKATLIGRTYTVILFNAGDHDLKRGIHHPTTPIVPLDAYRKNIEAAAQLAEQHASVVIWVDTLPIPDGVLPYTPGGLEGSYNTVADEIAHKHGFYVLHLKDAEHKPNNIHYTTIGDIALAQQVADCVMTVLSQQETGACHK